MHPNSWAIGLSAIPDSWADLKRLRTLQLQGHTLLEVRLLVAPHACPLPMHRWQPSLLKTHGCILRIQQPSGLAACV